MANGDESNGSEIGGDGGEDAPRPDPLDRHEKRAKIVSAYGGLLLPVAVLVATLMFNHSNARTAARQKCVDQTLQVLNSEAARSDAGQSPTREQERRQMLATMGDLMLQSCGSAGIEIPPLVSATLEREGREAEGTQVGAVLSRVADRAEQSGEREGPAIVLPSTPAPRPVTGTVLLYIHISEESQRAAAEALARGLEGAAFAGRRIDVQGVELVANRGDDSLRCLKRADCARVGELAALVNQRLAGRSIRAVDLSARFENARNVAPGTYELWFGAGEIGTTGGTTAGGTTGGTTAGGGG